MLLQSFQKVEVRPPRLHLVQLETSMCPEKKLLNGGAVVFSRESENIEVDLSGAFHCNETMNIPQKKHIPSVFVFLSIIVIELELVCVLTIRAYIPALKNMVSDEIFRKSFISPMF